MAKRLLKDWQWFMDEVKLWPTDLVLKGPRIEGFEADVLRIEECGYTVEYEIKIARSDYKIDFFKYLYKGGFGFDNPGKQVFKHDLIKSGKLVNQYYFAVPVGLITVDEVPEYAGLIYLNKPDFKVVKQAPILSSISRKAMYDRYKRKSL